MVFHHVEIFEGSRPGALQILNVDFPDCFLMVRFRLGIWVRPVFELPSQGHLAWARELFLVRYISACLQHPENKTALVWRPVPELCSLVVTRVSGTEQTWGWWLGAAVRDFKSLERGLEGESGCLPESRSTLEVDASVKGTSLLWGSRNSGLVFFRVEVSGLLLRFLIQ